MSYPARAEGLVNSTFVHKFHTLSVISMDRYSIFYIYCMNVKKSTNLAQSLKMGARAAGFQHPTFNLLIAQSVVAVEYTNSFFAEG